MVDSRVLNHTDWIRISGDQAKKSTFSKHPSWFLCTSWFGGYCVKSMLYFTIACVIIYLLPLGWLYHSAHSCATFSTTQVSSKYWNDINSTIPFWNENLSLSRNDVNLAACNLWAPLWQTQYMFGIALSSIPLQSPSHSKSNWILTILILFSALEMASFAILDKGDGAPD